MLGIPFMSDQKLNMQNLASKGVAVVLDRKHITWERLLTALRTVLYDPRSVQSTSASPWYLCTCRYLEQFYLNGVHSVVLLERSNTNRLILR